MAEHSIDITRPEGVQPWWDGTCSCGWKAGARSQRGLADAIAEHRREPEGVDPELLEFVLNEVDPDGVESPGFTSRVAEILLAAKRFPG